MPTIMNMAWSEKYSAAAEVGDEVADDGGAEDGEAAHRRRALLVLVLGPAVLLAEDRLALAPAAEERR